MTAIQGDPQRIGCCGLYCAACSAYRRKKCPGCKANDSATWCGVRKCCGDRALISCATCNAFEDFHDCGKLNNLISKVIGFVSSSSRVRSVKKLKELGPEEYARFMSAQGLKCIKKNMP
jgi:hypothetical protein